MVKSLDEFAHDVPATPLTTSRDQFAERAYSLLTSSAAQAAFRIDDEPDGGPRQVRPDARSASRACWPAGWSRPGVSFVTVNDRGTGPLGWDTHAQNFPTIKNTLAPPLDKGVAALVEDLAERGLLDDTLVVMMGEFGRTPKINPNAGRDHHGRANCVLLFGAGIPAGLVLGRTDADGDAPVERPVTPADLASVLYHKLGIDPETTHSKRPTAGRSAWSTAPTRRGSWSDGAPSKASGSGERCPGPRAHRTVTPSHGSDSVPTRTSGHAILPSPRHGLRSATPATGRRLLSVDS